MSSRERKIDDIAALKIAGFVILLAVLVWLAYQLRDLIVAIVMALVLASAIAPIAEKAETRGIPRSITVIGVFLAVVAVYALAAVALFPALKEQAINLAEHLPMYLQGISDWYEQLRALAGDKGDAISVNPTDVRNVVLKLLQQTLNVTTGIVGMILNVILVLFLTAYFVIDATHIWGNLLKWVPPEHRQRVGDLIRPLGARMGGYVSGQLTVSLAVSIFLCVGLSLLGVNYSLVLGVLAGLLNLMPFVGSMLTAVFTVLVAFNQSPWLGGAVIILFTLEQWVESNFIVPQLLGKQVNLHPIVVLVAILTGASLMGLPGALVSVPLASAATLLAKEFYLKPLDAPSQEA